MLHGVLTALITKHTKEVRVVEPLAMMIMAYLAYMVAEMLHWSGILSLVGCGILQSHYAFKNISEKAQITTHFFISMLREGISSFFLVAYTKSCDYDYQPWSLCSL